jgi:PKD domain-containing protein/Big-like domain-containing protein
MISIITGLRHSRNVRLCAFVACAAILTAACDKMPLLAPQESTIKLSASSTVVQTNGTTEIRATVLEPSGTPVQNGTTVTFTTNLGTVSPGEARTLNGVATVQFLGNGQSGKATITAISGGAASDPLELSVGAAAAGRVSVSANPTSVPSTGGTTTVSAVVVDASGNALSGVPVTFTTTAGSFNPAVVNTDSSGVARTTLTTNSAATISATAGGTKSADVTISVSVRPTVTIGLASGSANPSVGTVTTFSISATPATGGAPIQSVVVNFGDGESVDLGAVSGTITVQHVYGDDGTLTPTVTAQDSTGTSASASTVIVVQPILVSITAAQSATDPQTFTFTANVSPTSASTSIASYTWTFGDGATVTTSSNTISHTYTTSGTKTVRVTARTSTNRTFSGSTTVIVPP